MNNQLVFSSSSSSSSSSFCIDSTPSWRYEVFLSFRGEDTRTTFTDHLYKALVDKGIPTFIDRQLVRGEEISPALLQAIEESRISLVIFSRTYAASRWCLDELVKIFQCRQSKQQIVLPVFYKVDPSHVRNQTSSFGDEFKKLECKFEDNKEKILAWRSALREAADLSGHPVKEGDYEATLISNIVEDILVKVLDGTYLDVAKYPVGIQSCVREVKDLLGVDGNGRRVVGIWGTSGIGKTTIAKAVYNAIAHKFEGSCFLGDVRESSTSREGLIQLQKTFLSEILRGTEWEIVNVHQGISLIKNRLRQKKILLILDDVDQLEQLKNWVDVDCFGEGSRVIITTKDRSLLDFYGGQWIYEVQKLEDDKALELFSWNAFERNKPPDDYLSLARCAIAYAQGLPLALNLIGSYLRKKSIGRWQAVLDSYDSYEGEPYKGIQRILRKSYDALDYALQQVFLDIACFFKGEHECYVLEILRSSKLYVPQHCLDVLVEKAIISIHNKKIWMHDLLEQMGKRIVCEESPTEPRKRSRLWHHEDVRNVLIDCKGTKKIRGIVVNLPEPDVIPLNEKSFWKMENLEFFINRNAHFSGCVNYLPNSLRLIEFGGRSNIDQRHTYVPSNFHPRDLVCFDRRHTYVLNLPSNFYPRHLVKFDVSFSGIRQLKEFKIGKSGIRELPSSIAYLTGLADLVANGCELQNVPDLSGSPNIRMLDLRDCTSLVEVHDSVGFLDKLHKLDLSGCSKLTRFPTRLGSRSLYYLSLEGCRRLERFPEIENDKMKSLMRLEIGKSGIKELPSSIAYLTGLADLVANGCELQNVPDLSESPNISVLDLRDCTSLVEVDDSVGFLDKRQELHLDGCSKLTRFATRLESRSLRHLNIGRSGIRELPSSIAYLTGLQTLKASGCELQNIQLLPFGKKVKFDEVSSCSTNLRMSLDLELEGCNLSESDFLVPLDCWSALTSLDLSRNNFVSLPDCISKVVNLETLILKDCKRLWEIPVLPPKLEGLYLDDCTSLEKIPKLPPRLKHLKLCNCFGLSGDEVAKLENNLLNEKIYPRSELGIIYPGNEVPKWFTYTSNHPTTVLSFDEWDGSDSEFRFEIPLKLQVGETLVGLALSFVLEQPYCSDEDDDDDWEVGFDVCIFINGEKFRPYIPYKHNIQATHVLLWLVDLWEQEQQGDICQVVIPFHNGSPIKSCGVHCLLRNQDELLHLSLRPTSSVGKRPRPRGSSDIVDDEYDQQKQWLSSSSEPAEDHPKRRQIDPNVPIDIEEDEEQEQPSASDDPQFLIY
ncbi:TMV resistance protein N-like [Pyrus ussuriensis x Pyrus communis]|uniref:TMV resistance protein N-like n=1 Tax=Pyrus ussuriensis x Pyrus communis TaxID=2448454 RepID=A0A5N5I5Z8_9ROSA|nr:TMV resistance protein N-like [Pyrus ussuriensis x Pyrus communis]